MFSSLHIFLCFSKGSRKFPECGGSGRTALPRQLPPFALASGGIPSRKLRLDSRHSGGASSIIEPKQERGAASLFALPGWLPDGWVLCLESRLRAERITEKNNRQKETDGDERKLDVKVIGKVDHGDQAILAGGAGCRNTRLASD